ncbi:hypothetical protein DFP72DRAFT_806348 [Ephemerocybe angulata]|uniref:Uncharacterized protein n=1 Tax=Ephemerocybe angulata TaxID=980116 RepID=A0A8H6I5Q9_9AGAR|nr:hypothetical protein DFP72DRAFT_806348 [Tulosesus angulatus]
MHLICLNLTELLMELWRGTIELGAGDTKEDWDWVVLTGDAWKEHGKFVEHLREFLLSSIERPPRNPEKKINSGYKAQEWLIYIFGYGPALLRGLLPEKYWLNFCKLVAAIRLLSSRTITLAEVLQAHAYLLEFVREFEELYVQRKLSRIHFVRPCVHNLMHLGPETFRIGPQTLFAQWTMERTIGNLGEEIKQHSNPYQNLSQRGVRRAQVNAMFAMMPDLNPSTTKGGTGGSRQGSLHVGGGYILLRPRDSIARPIPGEERDALQVFLVREGFHGVVPKKLVRWGRLELPSSLVVRSAWKEHNRSLDKSKRTSRMITVSECPAPCTLHTSY